MAKIAIIHEVLGRSKGGIEAWIYHASEELLKQGHKVTLFHTMDIVPDDAAPEGVVIVNIPRKTVSPSIFFLRLMKNSKKFLKGKIEAFDAVWVRSFTMAWCAAELLPKERTLYVNAAPYAYYARRPIIEQLKRIIKDKEAKFSSLFSNQVSYLVAYFSEKSAIQKCTNVYLSRERKRQTLKFFNIKELPNKYCVVPAGVDIKRFSPPGTKWDGRTPLKIITVCRLTKEKNVQCILDAVKRVNEKGCAVHFTIIGSGIYWSELTSMAKKLNIQNQVSFMGQRKDVENWYRDSHLFILPSLYEGFGSVYIEAMASGLPCIAISSQSGKYNVAADEIIDHGENGFLMSDNSSEELTEYISNLYSSPETLSEFSDNARIKATEYFSWEKAIKKLLTISIK